MPSLQSGQWRGTRCWVTSLCLSGLLLRLLVHNCRQRFNTSDFGSDLFAMSRFICSHSSFAGRMHAYKMCTTMVHVAKWQIYVSAVGFSDICVLVLHFAFLLSCLSNYCFVFGKDGFITLVISSSKGLAVTLLLLSYALLLHRSPLFNSAVLTFFVRLFMVQTHWQWNHRALCVCPV